MGAYPPEYLIREQEAVGALVVFGALRVAAAALTWRRGWPPAWAGTACIGVACLYALPELAGWLAYGQLHSHALAGLEGKAAGCAIALFFAPILSHRLGYE